jgi:hypothetical protein
LLWPPRRENCVYKFGSDQADTIYDHLTHRKERRVKRTIFLMDWDALICSGRRVIAKLASKDIARI